MKPLSAALLVAIGLSAAACSVSSPSENTRDTITGTIPKGGVAVHTFTFSKRGESSLKITSITPTINGSLGAGIGIVLNGGCSLFTFQQVVLNLEIPFATLDAGTYCIQISDPTGVVVNTATYSGTFSHP